MLGLQKELSYFIDAISILQCKTNKPMNNNLFHSSSLLQELLDSLFSSLSVVSTERLECIGMTSLLLSYQQFLLPITIFYSQYQSASDYFTLEVFGKASRCSLKLSFHSLLSHTTADPPQFTLDMGRIIYRTLSIKIPLDCLTWAASLACGPWVPLKLLGAPVEVSSFRWLSPALDNDWSSGCLLLSCYLCEDLFF